jgi:hypothetical protein
MNPDQEAATERIVCRLRGLERDWPAHLALNSMDGTLTLMVKRDDGLPVQPEDEVDTFRHPERRGRMVTMGVERPGLFRVIDPGVSRGRINERSGDG